MLDDKVPSEAKHSVLVVDDDRLSVEVLSVLLDAEGYNVMTASSGEDALALLGTLCMTGKLPRAVLADFQMPGLAGNELAERLRALCASSVHLVAMSASEPEPSLIAGYDRFLRKPICMKSLVRALDGLEHAKSIETEELSHPGIPVLDDEVYAKLAVAMSPQQIVDLYRFFVADARQRVDRMRLAVEQQDESGFRKEAHALLGGCGMLGALEMRVLAREMEEFGFGERTRLELDALLDDLTRTCERLRSMLEARWQSDV